MIKTKGLTHLHLMVRDLQRSLTFYETVFGMQEQFRPAPELVFIRTPGSNDLIALHQASRTDPAGPGGGILHFGFELQDKSQLDAAIAAVIAGGGALKKKGSFGPGLDFAYVTDPDGYEIEL